MVATRKCGCTCLLDALRRGEWNGQLVCIIYDLIDIAPYK